MKTKTLFLLAVSLIQLSSFAQYTAIPDANFEQALITKGYDSGALDGKVLTANINTVTYLNVINCSITDLTGIQDFISLQNLNCASNQLTSLKLNGLTVLRSLSCDDNKITSLNLSGLTTLQILNCSTNQLTSLNVSGLTALTFLYCVYNQLTSLKVSGLTALTDLRCSYNQLTSLNLSGLIALTDLNCSSNPSLSCIQIDINATKITKYWIKDATASFSLNCPLLSANSYELAKGVVVFPNPTQSILNLSSATTLDKIIITDLTGKTVLHQTLPSNHVNVQQLARGIYILQVFSRKEKFQTKFVKE